MTSHQALIGLLLAAALGACAVQVDEPARFEPSAAAGATSSAGKGGMTTSAGKGGSTSSASSPSSGGMTSSGKGGSTGSSGGAGSGGQAAGGQTTVGGGGDEGVNGGSSGSGSGGTQGTVSCAGLPEWVADTNPTPALQPGDPFTYMNQRFVLGGSMPVTYWNGECPPEASRPTWCDTNYAFTGPMPCQ